MLDIREQPFNFKRVWFFVSVRIILFVSSAWTEYRIKKKPYPPCEVKWSFPYVCRIWKGSTIWYSGGEVFLADWLFLFICFYAFFFTSEHLCTPLFLHFVFKNRRFHHVLSAKFFFLQYCYAKGFVFKILLQLSGLNRY